MRGEMGGLSWCFSLKPLRPQEEAPCLRARPEGRGPWRVISGKMTIIVEVPMAADGQTPPPGTAVSLSPFARMAVDLCAGRLFPVPSPNEQGGLVREPSERGIHTTTLFYPEPPDPTGQPSS